MTRTLYLLLLLALVQGTATGRIRALTAGYQAVVRQCLAVNGTTITLTEPDICSNTTLCSDHSDQMNCTDKGRVGLYCTDDNNYEVNISQFAVCRGYSLCSGGYDNNCMRCGDGSRVHKLRLCDGLRDCEDGSDETGERCLEMTKKEKCVRRTKLNGPKLAFPLEWIMDGDTDCQNDTDEEDYKYKPCKGDKDYVERDEFCWEKIKCRDQGSDVIVLSDICNSQRITCEEQPELCELSRTFAKPSDVVETSENGTKVLSYCSPEQGEMINQDTGWGCETVPFVTPGTLVRLPTEHGVIDCSKTFGETYVYLSCLDRCSNDTVCPLTTNNTCPINNDAIEEEDHIEYYFRCSNERCVPYRDVCNLQDDCGDGSDEVNCSNNFHCTQGIVPFIPLTSKCDGVLDCGDLSDECNSDCPAHARFILGGDYVLIVTACTIGSLSIVLNSINIYRASQEIGRTKWFRSALTKLLISFIAVGDLLMGCYLVTMAFIDASDRHNYCKSKYLWLSSTVCATLGVISSCGSQMSVLSMTVLAIFRVLTVRSKTVVKETAFSDFAKTKLRTIALLIIGISSLIAILPLLQRYEDFFVTSLYYHGNPMFHGEVTKEYHLELLEIHYGRLIEDSDLSWSTIRELVRGMFTEEYSGVEGSSIHFYGSDGVCVAKYLVTPNDPQRYFTLSILGTNFLCFLIISICYISINLSITKTPITATVMRPAPNIAIRDRWRKRTLQAKTGAIMASDFLCWIPFIFVCLLHYGGFIDARPLYPFFSVVLLPINSLINPLLYDSRIVEWVIGRFKAVYRQCNDSCWCRTNRLINPELNNTLESSVGIQGSAVDVQSSTVGIQGSAVDVQSSMVREETAT